MFVSKGMRRIVLLVLAACLLAACNKGSHEAFQSTDITGSDFARNFALTDHNSVSGSMEFAQSARSLGLRALHGAEFDLDDGRHLTLLVRDSTGWANLCRLLMPSLGRRLLQTRLSKTSTDRQKQRSPSHTIGGTRKNRLANA